ncbi:MAG: hypothetical protein ACKO8T_08515 [Actinomycetota bacterium]
MSALWSRILAATWVLVALAHGFVSVASRRTGKPLWWVDNHGIAGDATPIIGAAVVYLAMLVAFVIALRRAPRSPFISAMVAVGLGVSAVADLAAAPGSALVAVAASASAFVASVAALAGRTAHR